MNHDDFIDLQREIDRLRVIEHLAWHVCESAEEDTGLVDLDDLKALAAVLPMEHPAHAALPSSSADEQQGGKG